MGVDRTATNVWKGDLQNGSGIATFDTTGLAGPLEVSWPARTGDPEGKTSPEELIAAAHASCFNMALSNALAKAGNPPEELTTSATVTFSTDGGAHISRIALSVRGQVPGITSEQFAEAAEGAKGGCPVSKLVAGNVELVLDATLR